MKRFKAIKRLKIENWLNNFLWVNIKTEKIKRLFHSRKLHNNGKKFIFFSFWSYFSLSYYDIKGKTPIKISEDDGNQYKSFSNIPVFMINDILCFFLVTKEAQVEAAEGNQDLPDNSSLGEKNS